MVAGANAEVRQSATSEKASLRRALEGARVTDSPTRLAEALWVAETLIRDRPDAEIHLFSDGAIPELAEFETRDLRLVYHKVGKGARNAGIVAFDVKPNPEDPAKRALFLSLANHRSETVDVRIEVAFDGQLIETKSVMLAATNTTPVVFIASQSRDGVFTARLVAEQCARSGKALVIGTTGHTEEEKTAIRALAQRIPIVWASNYSTGVNTLFWLTRKAAEILGPGFDLEVVEMHHRMKRDAPSGTATTLLEIPKRGSVMTPRINSLGTPA